MLNPRLAQLTDKRIQQSLRERPIRQPPPVEPDRLAAALGRVIVRIRRRRRLSQRRLAGLLDISPSAVSRWEAGHRFPTVSHLAGIAQLDGRPASALLGEAEELARRAQVDASVRDTTDPDRPTLEDDHAADD